MLIFAAEIDRLYCPQINNKTLSENQHRNSLRPEIVTSHAELHSLPETETWAEVTRVSLEGTANKANTGHAVLQKMELELFPDFKMPLLLS